MKKIVFAILVALSFNLFGGGPWVNPKGSLYTQLSYTFLKYNNVFNQDGETVEVSDYVSDYSLNSYTEYSITDRTSLNLTIPFKMLSHDGNSQVGFGDIEIAGKTALFKDASPLTGYYELTLPTSQRNVNQLNTGYNRLAVEAGLSSGFALDKYYAYLSAGYRYRNDVNDQVVFDFEAARAFKIKELKLYLALTVTGALNTSEYGFNVLDEVVLYNYNTAYVSPGLKVMYNFTGDLWLNVSGQGAFYAAHAAAAPALTFGLAYNIQK